MEERELVRRCVAGDPLAWEAFVRAHADLVWRAVRTVLHAGTAAASSDAEDASQRTFLLLWEDGRRRLSTFEEGRRLGPWLFSIARREAMRVLRRLPRPAPPLAPEEAPPPTLSDLAGSPSDEAEANESARRLREAIRSLPPRDRLLVRLVYFDGAPYEEAARLLGCPLGSVSPWLERARRKIRLYFAASSPPIAR